MREEPRQKVLLPRFKGFLIEQDREFWKVVILSDLINNLSQVAPLCLAHKLCAKWQGKSALMITQLNGESSWKHTAEGSGKLDSYRFILAFSGSFNPCSTIQEQTRERVRSERRQKLSARCTEKVINVIIGFVFVFLVAGKSRACLTPLGPSSWMKSFQEILEFKFFSLLLLFFFWVDT